jgi:hypothetical protein
MEAGTTASAVEGHSSELREDARAVAWWVLTGVAAGAVAGFLVGGVGTSPEIVLGAISDDGFEIGVVTTDTLNLVAGMTALGGLNGLVYAAVRGWLPRRLRLPLWIAVSSTVVGGIVVHEDGIDFTLIEPAALAIALFVALPAAAAALVVVLVERWADRPPFAERRLAFALAVASVCASFALVPALAAWCVAVAGRRIGLARTLRPIGCVVAPVAIAAVAVVAAVGLVGEASRLL